MAIEIDWYPQPKQKMALRAFGLGKPFALDERERQTAPRQRVARVIGFGGSAGGGKLLDVHTPIATPGGWKCMGDLQAGDAVFDAHGNPTTVTEAFEVDPQPESYRLEFDDGSFINAGADHRWLTFDAKELAELTKRSPEWRAKRRAKRPSRVSGRKSAAFVARLTYWNKEHPPETRAAPTGTVRTTREIVSTLKVRGTRTNHAIPVAGSLELPDAHLPLDPYCLGAWLGDGASAGGIFTGADPEIWGEFERVGFTVTHGPGRKYAHYVKGLVQLLRPMGLLCNKHVPNQYLRASRAQRLALLQGLMDTDGNVHWSGAAEFTTTSERLARDVHELVVSLGWKTRIAEGRATLYGRDCGPKYRMNWSPDDYVFRLPRKREKQKLATRRTTKFRYITNCIRIDPIPMRCIAVDSPDHLYLAGESMIPTHNSATALAAALAAQMVHPGCKVAIFRRTFPELSGLGGLILDSMEMYGSLGKWHAQDHRWTFWENGHIQFCHCQREEDVYNYQSWQFDYLFIDEATHFTEFQVRYLMTRNRATVDGVKPLAALFTNPGNVGHLWFKRWFIDLGEPFKIHTYKPRDEEVSFTTQNVGQIAEPDETHLFIPSKLEDNKILEERDPGYRQTLMNQPEEVRQALLEGNWDVFAGQVLRNWRKEYHVCEPFEIPEEWVKWCGVDWGYAKPFCCLWAAQDPDTEIKYVYREFYKSRLSDPEQAQAIKTLSGDEKIAITLADPSMWTKRTVERRSISTAEVYEQNGVPLTRADNDRMMGLRRVQELLELKWIDDDTQKPGVIFFDSCVNCIRTLPALPHDTTNVEDVDTDAEDHGFDSLRYLVLWKVSGGPRKEPYRRRPSAERRGYWGNKKLRPKRAVIPAMRHNREGD
jgi:hypothetical protein